MEGVGQDIDIGVYDMTANNIISSSLESSNGGGLLYTDVDGKILSMSNVLSYDSTSNKIDLVSSRMMDVSNGIFVLSQSQKASIVEGVGQDIDIGVYDMTANNIISSSLESSNGGGLLYTDVDGKILSMSNVLSYDSTSNKIDLVSSRMMDVSNGIFVLSQSQKASIVEGVGQDIDIGVYDMTANNIISSSLESSNGGGLLYTDVDGKILSMSNVLSYDSTSNKIDLVSSRMMDVSNGIFVLSQSQKASIVEGVGQDIDIGVYDMTANNIISSSLESSNGGGLLYTDVDGKILSMSNVLSYDSTSNKIDLVSSRMMDVSNGIFVLSQSQKASIVEGVGQDIDIGVYDMTANNIISSSLESSNGGGLLYTDVDGKILSMSNVLSYDSTSNKIDLVSSRMMDVSNGIFVLSQSQKASIVEGVGQDIDIGVYDMTANNIISSSLESSNGGGLLYTDVDGKILSMSNVLSYDSTSNKIDLVSSRMMDVSNGIFVLSQSQKASIVEGVGQDIDIGVYDMTANNIISSSLESSNGGGLLYTDVDGKILSMSNVLSYDSTSNKIDLVSSRMMDVSNGIFVLSQSQKASIVEGVGQDIDIGVYDMTANNIISSSLESSNGGGLLYTDVDGKILSMSNVLSYDSTSNKIDLVSSRMMDVSNGIFVLSQSQKASIVEGVGQDIDIGVYDMTANNIISSSLESSNGGGLLYTDVDGKILSMSNVLSYDSTSNKIDLVSSRMMDVSNGIFVLSQSQKASIVEGVGQDIDIGVYDMTANNIISSSLESSNGGGLLYTDVDGKILSMSNVLSYDSTSNKIDLVIKSYDGCIKWYICIKSKSKSINRGRCWSRY